MPVEPGRKALSTRIRPGTGADGPPKGPERPPGSPGRHLDHTQMDNCA